MENLCGVATGYPWALGRLPSDQVPDWLGDSESELDEYVSAPRKRNRQIRCILGHLARRHCDLHTSSPDTVLQSRGNASALFVTQDGGKLS